MIDKEIVCVIENDVCYHRPECDTVNKNSSFALRTEAKKGGLLPCMKCKPDYTFKKKTDDYGVFEAHNPKQGVVPVGASLEDTDVVYITDTGLSYHRQDCGYLKYGSSRISRVQANKYGYKACKVCKP